MKKKFVFEDALTQLEDLLADLESNKLSIDDSMTKFEKGVQIYKDCKKYLDRVEQKIQVITDDEITED